MAIFYAAYFLKAIQQREEGVSTMILGKGNKPQQEKNIERWLKILTFSLPVVEVVSIFRKLMALPEWWHFPTHCMPAL